jgi:outer membrane protein
MKKPGLVLLGGLAAAGTLLAGNPAARPPVQTLTIDEAVIIALRQNPEIRNAKQEIERLRGVVIEVRAQALPQIGLVGSYSQQDRRLISQGGSARSGNGASDGNKSIEQALAGLSESGGAGTGAGGGDSAEVAQALAELQGQGGQSGGNNRVQNKSWRVAIEGRQLLYSGGQVRSALRIARFTEDSSYYELRDVIDTIVARVRQQFYQVLLNRSTIRVQEESIRLLENQLTDQRNRLEAGTVPRFNVLQAEVALENARPDLIRARNNYRISQLELARTLGVDYDRSAPNWVPFNAVGELSIPPRPFTLAEAVDLAKAQRPLLKVQRHQILIQVEQIKIALSGYKPAIAANGGYEVRNRQTSQQLTDTINGWFFGFTGTWDIFDGFETFGRTKQARAQLEQAKVTYEDSVHQVELEVQQADARLKEADELLQSADKTIEQAQESQRLAQERLSAGAGVQLDVLNARVALLQAQTTALQARYDYNAALAEFDRVTGTATRYEETFNDPLMQKVKRFIERDTAQQASSPAPVPRGVKK